MDFFFYVMIMIMLAFDFLVFNRIKKKINKWYKKSIDVLNKINPLTKLELKQSKGSFLMRMLILALFWLCINFIIKFEYIIKSNIIDLSEHFEEPINMFYDYIIYIFIIIGCFVYFFINIYSKTNSYIRTYDIISGIIVTRFMIFIS